jgi:oxepin-CoA hydrolase/3-oxo-5,6-dehydrosuberyl-CoA semialdehyde dehydrogenase
MDEAKFNFIKTDFPLLAGSLSQDAAGKWGKMNAQQMLEHVADFYKISTGKITMPFVSSPEHLEKLRAFLYSEKEFRENTKAPMLPDEPFPVRNASMNDALAELNAAIDDFIRLFTNEEGLLTQHPVFGDLNFEEWVLLHYKHVLHHAKQFGLI